MPSQLLAFRQRAWLALGVFATLFVLGVLQCPSLSVAQGTRCLLTVTSVALGALCVAILLEDAMARPLRNALRGLRLRHAF